jgi:hypothetical protein
MVRLIDHRGRYIRRPLPAWRALDLQRASKRKLNHSLAICTRPSPDEVTCMQNPQPENGPSLNRTIQLKIGRGLREMYDGLTAEPVPDRLAGLLAQLEDRAALKRSA